MQTPLASRPHQREANANPTELPSERREGAATGTTEPSAGPAAAVAGAAAVSPCWRRRRIQLRHRHHRAFGGGDGPQQFCGSLCCRLRQC